MSAAPFYCPYCGDEDLRPAVQPPAAWYCGDCQRVFVVHMMGLAAPGNMMGLAAPGNMMEPTPPGNMMEP